MKTIDPTRESLAQLKSLPQDQPVIMLNLLRFREQAAYPADADQSPCAGHEAYKRYLALADTHVARVGGEVLWMGKPQANIIAPPDEHWDSILLVRYPSPAAFSAMLRDPDYRAASVHRTAALEDSRLIAARQTQAQL